MSSEIVALTLTEKEHYMLLEMLQHFANRMNDMFDEGNTERARYTKEVQAMHDLIKKARKIEA